ncbi:MAG: orotidine 5'-phosphate decarboxylase, partial [Prolixibacteraceae bacterium]|nr:orotidine 5'-phosphate decarboxylase [Prolixibacteraceae bacterium]
MNRQELFTQIKEKRSFLVVGLDTDIRKIPKHLHGLSDDPLFEFNRQIIENTADLCVGYKINLAFFESEGPKGWNAVEKTVNYIRENHLSQFVIADAKRGDIGNTSSLYART